MASGQAAADALGAGDDPLGAKADAGLLQAELLILTMIIPLMFCGFALLEVGSVRSKNATAILFKVFFGTANSFLCPHGMLPLAAQCVRRAREDGARPLARLAWPEKKISLAPDVLAQ